MAYWNLDLSRFMGWLVFTSREVKLLAWGCASFCRCAGIWIFGLISYIHVGDGDYVWTEELWLAPGVLSRVSIPLAVT